MNWRLLITGLVLVACGCDLFTTRKAETPNTGQSSWDYPRVPQDVLRNLTLSLAERNSVDYLRSFQADTFSFIADAVALSSHPELGQWGLPEETHHITQLLSGGVLPGDSLLSVVFEPQEQTEFSDSAYLREKYTLRAGVTTPGVAHEMAGTAEFYLGKGAESYWVIRRWVDSRTEGQATWSDLKAAVR